MKATQEQLKLKLEQALVTAFGAEYTGVDPMLVSASNPKFGDYQSNIALSLAKRIGQQPRAIAAQIVDKLDVSNICEPTEVAGAGFINLKLKTAHLEDLVAAIEQDPRLGVAPVKNPQQVIVDYPSPNIAKEMHVGHLRPAVIGDCLARILEFIGHEVLRISHVGDWGTPFGMLIAYLEEAYPQALTTTENLNLGDLSSFYRQAKRRFDTDDKFQQAARQAVVNLQAGDENTLLAWKIVCELSSRSYRVIYNLMGISSNIIERGESFYNPLLPEVVQELDQLGLLVESDGAKCVFLEGFKNKEGKPLPMIVQKSDGGYNYATTDLAAIRYRTQVEHVQRVIYPVGAEQSNHFAQIFQVGRKAGWITEETEFIHAPFGLVLGEDGQKLKTRSGDAVRLQDLLEGAITHVHADLEARLKEEGRTETEEFVNHAAQIVGISAIKYADLSQNRNSNYIFSYEKMLALKGNTAPYMLYAYVRTQGISRTGNIDFEQLGANTKIILQEDAEITLAKHLLQLDEVISEVEAELLPNRLCEYLYQLSDKLNKFYENCPVLQSAEPIRTSRLVLCHLTARTLKLGLSLLGIPVLERM